MKHIDYSHATKNLSFLMDEVAQHNLPVTITRIGKDPAVLISYALFKELLDRAVHHRSEGKKVQRLDEI